MALWTLFGGYFMSTKIYAHTTPDEWQTLEDHQEQTAIQASKFAKKFDSADWAWNAAFLHDLGKIDQRFQKKLNVAQGLDYEYENATASGSGNHSGAGAAYAEERYGKIHGRTLAYLIAGHHAGLPDYMEDKTGNAALRIRMNEAKRDLEIIREKMESHVVGLENLSAFPDFVKGHNYHLWVRMLFSCLVDADWLDTERVMDFKKSDKRKSLEFPTIDELSQKFWEYMNKKISESDQTARLNCIRNEILEACRKAAECEPGLFTLTVPTGGGKTLSSMAFALEHAQKHRKDRIIYVIPYTSIIEQTANIFRNVFDEGNVVEHHSNVSGDDEDRVEMDMAAENWDASIIVTTNVQFFESLYAAKPKKCRKLHNIVNSVVLIDEAQLISPEYVTPCVDVINELTQSFGVSLVLCTATQPALPGLRPAYEIVPDPQRYYEELKRVKYKFPENVNQPTTWEELAEDLKRHKEVLCVVNTRKDCRMLYDLLKEIPGTFHLSALMCGEHRSEVIEEIRRRLKKNRELKASGKPLEPLRVISTQLVEAGVDIDFPVVYRALAGLDSIVQAAGRCNREGKLEYEGQPVKGEVYVFVPEKPAPKGLLRKGEDTTIALLALGTLDSQDPSTFTQYFDLFYKSLNETGQNILDDLKPSGREGSVYFRTVGERFQLIDDQYTSPVIVRYGKSVELLNRLQQEGPHKELMRKLQRFTVNVPHYAVREMCDQGMIRFLEFRGKMTNILLQNTDCYQSEYGFDIMRRSLSCEESIV